MSDLLPINASDVERALDVSTSERFDNLPVEHGELWTPSEVKADFLPWLAHALSVDTWESDWSDSIKREVIAQSVEVHRRKGTIGAVRRALAATGVISEITEWFNADLSPHKFNILVDVTALVDTGTSFDAGVVSKIVESVDAAKPVRSYYDITPFYKKSGTTNVGAVAVITLNVEVYPT